MHTKPTFDASSGSFEKETFELGDCGDDSAAMPTFPHPPARGSGERQIAQWQAGCIHPTHRKNAFVPSL